MPLARGAKTHHKAQGPGRHIALIRMRHDRGIEKRRRFQGVFAGKHRANEQLAVLRQLSLREHMTLDHLEMIQHHLLDIEMTGMKFLADHLQLGLHLLLAQQQGAANDGGDARFLERNERANDHPRTLGLQNDVMTTQDKGLH